MNDTDALLGPWLQHFLVHHVVAERNLSRNACKSYRDTFKLLIPFACAQLGKQDYQLAVPDLSSELVRRFLDHGEDQRGCGADTRNQRLTAIRAFARFVASHDPAHVAWRGEISAIASKKTTTKPVPWLTVDEMHALLEVPDRTTRHGRVEHAILLFLYKTGARVSEATQLRVGDLQVGRRDGGHALVTLHGKGGKVRQCPLRPEIERVLIGLIDGHAADDAVFLNRRRQPFTRFGVYWVVERWAAQVPALAGRKITPHVLRHTTASHLVFAAVDINTVRAWLGQPRGRVSNGFAGLHRPASRSVDGSAVPRPSPERPPAAPIKARLCLQPARRHERGGVMAAAGGRPEQPRIGKVARDSGRRPVGGAMAETRPDSFRERGPTDADHVSMPLVDDGPDPRLFAAQAVPFRGWHEAFALATGAPSSTCKRSYTAPSKKRRHARASGLWRPSGVSAAVKHRTVSTKSSPSATRAPLSTCRPIK